MNREDLDRLCKHDRSRRQGCLACLKEGNCVNADGNPICPPSRVICRECMDQITANLKAMVGKT